MSASDKTPAVDLSGTLVRVVFDNPETMWAVTRVKPDGGGPEIAVVGSLSGVGIGTPLLLRGQYVDDPKFGRQFRAESYRPKTPETIAGIEKYLGSGLIPGIGPELAKRIVDVFKHETLDVIAATPERLTEVEGIGEARAGAIARAYTEQVDLQNVMVFLRGHGVPHALAIRIYKQYGNRTMGVVRENPYRLALEVWGIGFRTADQIARKLGLSRDAPARVEAGLIHVLGEMSDGDGHVHAPIDATIDAAQSLLEVERPLLRTACDRLVASGLFVREDLGGVPCVSLPTLHEAETSSAGWLGALIAHPMRALKVDAEAAIADFETSSDFRLAEAQRRAVLTSIRHKCTVITGGPGVGKTTIIRAVVSIGRRAERKMALAAPTGRAAKRLSESTGMGAVTIHRLLEFQPQSGDFARNQEHPLDVDLAVIDEASMIDVVLFRHLMAALPAGAQLVLVGDVDQLPSVGPGSVLADIIDSGCAEVVRLTEIYRQAAESQIVHSAHKVNSGQLPALAPPAGNDPRRSDFYFIERGSPDDALSTIVELAAERVPARFGFDPVRELQILTPMHRGVLGTQNLNRVLQQRLNPAGVRPRELKRGDKSFRLGDKVMQIRNDYDKEVFNGDVGVVVGIDNEAATVAVEVAGGRTVEYERGELDQIVLAYAISIHKSQGSEYPALIVPISTQHYMMLQRNLLYTAITRGKQLVVLVGSRRAVEMAVRNQSSKQRHTWLAERLRNAVAARSA